MQTETKAKRKPTKADLLAALATCLDEFDCGGCIADKAAFAEQLRDLIAKAQG